MPKLSIFIFDISMKCKDYLCTNEVILNMPHDWKSCKMHGLNIDDMTWMKDCCLAFTKYKNDVYDWQDFIENYFTSQPKACVFAAAYDGHVLYADMLNNMTSIDNFPEEVVQVLGDIICHMEAVAGEKFSYSPMSDFWWREQEQCAKRSKIIHQTLQSALY